MKTVKEVCDLAGVSRRTLHYYDDLGLLKPSQVTAAGYRLYDEVALRRLQDILLFKALDIPLKDIQTLLNAPKAVRQSLLSDHLQILDMKRAHLDGVIGLVESMIKGEEAMTLEIFKTENIDQLQAEAKQRWGDTLAYQVFEERQVTDPSQTYQKHLLPIFQKAYQLSHLLPSDDLVRQLVRDLQVAISQYFYPCNDQVLAGLGQLYGTDERFRQTIDSQAGQGKATDFRHPVGQIIVRWLSQQSASSAMFQKKPVPLSSGRGFVV